MLPTPDYELSVVDQVEPEQDNHDTGDYYREEGVAGEEREHQDQKNTHPVNNKQL